MSDYRATPAGAVTSSGSPELTALRGRTVPAPPPAPAMSSEYLASVAVAQLNRQVELRSTPALTLSARHPFDPAGLMDIYQPGRLDTTSDRVFMRSDYDGNASAGYAQFTAPAAGSYLVATRFSGYRTTLRFSGPWGTASAFSATTSDHSIVTALWDGSAGATLFFNFSFTGGVVGYLESIEVRQLA
jgi:hypothetical protein